MTKYSPEPAIVIQIGVEERPTVLMVARTDMEEGRILDWVRSQPDLAELVQRAIDLHEAQAA